MNALVRALKREGVEVAGVDRLNLGQELAIQDLLAMTRFALLPQDDLNLAALLKSPLIGLDEDQLFSLAWQRPGHLWRALRDRAAEPPFAAAYATSRRLAEARRLRHAVRLPCPPRSGPQGGRRRLLERLGREASDPIDELLARARCSIRGSRAARCRASCAGSKLAARRDQARPRPEPAARAAHPDRARLEGLAGADRLPARHDTGAARTASGLLSGTDDEARLWLPRTDDANEAARNWRNEIHGRTLEEHNRLLYVAMTRAEDRLYVGGWVGSKKPDGGCWYERIEAGLRASTEHEMPEDAPPRVRAVARNFDFTSLLPDEGWSGEGYELANEGHIAETEQAELPIAEEAPLPPWWTEPAPGEPDPPTPLAPFARLCPTRPLPRRAPTAR